MQHVYPWLRTLSQQWQSLSETHRVPGAMLCSAPQGSGINQLAERFAHTLVCSNSTTGPCGFCHSCELTRSGNHPDVHWVEPEKEGKAITVDQIRLCNQWAVESSQLAGKRVIVISPAELMNESASNALLKTLESPAEHCVFLLLTTNKNQLLPTIISRCQKWDLAAPDIEVTYQWLNQQTDKTCNHVGIRLCNGAPLLSLAFFEQDGYKEFQALESAISLFLARSSLDTAPIWATIKEKPVRALAWLSMMMSDIQKVHFGVNQVGMCEKSVELAAIVPYASAYNAMLSANQLGARLRQHTGLNAELLVTHWLMELQEEICS